MDFTEIKSERFNEKYYALHHHSGLHIFVYPKKEFQSAFAIIGTKFGSVNSEFISHGEKISVPDGIAHYLEHKLFESEDGDAFSKYAKTGASANAFTSFNTTCYLFSCTQQFETSLKILINLITIPYFTKETVAKEQGIIGQEIKMYDDSPDWRSMMNVLTAMYQNHPVNKDIAGTVETIANITPEALYQCYNAYYNLNNMYLSVVGNVDPETVLKIADEKLKTAEPFDTVSVFPEEPYAVAQSFIEQKLDVTIPLFQLGFKHRPQEKYTEKDYACMDILLTAFTSESSQLYRELLDAELINATFNAEFFSGDHYEGVIFSGESNNPEKTADYIRSAVRKLHETGLSQTDFEWAKRDVYGRNISVLNKNSDTANVMMTYAFNDCELFKSIEAVADLTLDDVNRFLENRLDADNTALSIVR